MFPGETIRSGVQPVCPDCKIELALQICRSNAGYYIGTYCQCGPYSRESDYYGNKDELSKAWEEGNVMWRY